MSAYKPGTVAIATVRGVEGVRVVRTRAIDDAWFCPEYQEHNSEGLNGWWPDEDEVADVRPLVVLDLDESKGKSLLPMWLRNNIYRVEEGSVTPSSIGQDMAWLADQIEAQTKAPRIPEPGLWGVVEASREYPDGKGFGPTRWVRTTRAGLPWYAPQFDVHATWRDLTEPSLVREGVES